jgi:endonuclease/exonuclease/phosphatase family metal-dependent hydrolase
VPCKQIEAGFAYFRGVIKTTSSMKKNLPTSLLVLLLLLITSLLASAQVSLTALNVTYTENFNSLPSTGTANDITTLPLGWTFIEAGTNANTTYAAGTGTSNAGNTYSLGLDTDRALGGLQSGSLIPVIGASFVNNTGATITSLQIRYAGEQWRLGATPRSQADKLDFQFSTTATSLATGSWLDGDELDFNAPVLAGIVGSLNGNLSANRDTLSMTINGLLIPDGGTFWIRWNDFNVASSDDALAIDDFSLTPLGEPSNQPSFSFTPSTLNFGEVNTTTSQILSYSVRGTNLSDSVTTLISGSSAFLLSLDQITYADTLLIADTATVYVRFTPLIDSVFNEVITHVNAALTKTLSLTGSGYDPLNNIVSISTARSLPVGSKVTVTGRVTVSNQLGSPAYVQDATGGIPVFDFGVSQNVSIGDSLIVTGPIGVFNDQKQISGNGISFIKPDSSVRLLAPKSIILSELAANEGLLVTIPQVELVNKTFVFYPQSTERITDGTTQVDLRIDGDTNLPGLTKPQAPTSITGVVGRFRANAQLLPRFREDVPGAAEPTLPTDSIPTTNTFDLVTWNLEFFGARREDYSEEFGPADEALQLENVRKVITSLRADVIAVQEVSNDSLFTELVRQLPGYQSVCSNRFSRSFEAPSTTFPPQKVCFIYDTTSVQVISTRVLFESLYDSARTINPALLPGYPTGEPSSFWSSGRLPYSLTANVSVNGVTERIKFINLHAKSGASVADFDRRVYDAQVLKDSLQSTSSTEQVVILGDFNDDLDQSIVAGKPSSYAAFVTDSAYVSATKPLSLAGARSTISFSDMIDHQIISNQLKEELLPQSAQVVTPFAAIPDYGNTTTDHLPVVTRYAFVAPEATLFADTTSISESLDSVVVTVQLSKPVLEAKTLVISLNGSAVYGVDYETLPLANQNQILVTIPAGYASAQFIVRTLDDLTDEANEVIELKIQPTVGIDVTGSMGITLTILDNDVPAVEFAEAEVSREEGSGSYSVRLNFSSTLATAQSITIRAVNSLGVLYGNRWDYTTEPRIGQGRILLDIPAGASHVEFTVIPNSDFLREQRAEFITFSIESVSAELAIGNQSSLRFNIIDVRPCIPVFLAFPNPTRGTVNIYTLPANQDLPVVGSLLDPNGSVIVSGEGTVAELSELFTQSLQGRPRGVYTLRFIQCNEVISIRLLKL